MRSDVTSICTDAFGSQSTHNLRYHSPPPIRSTSMSDVLWSPIGPSQVVGDQAEKAVEEVGVGKAAVMVPYTLYAAHDADGQVYR